MKFLASLVAGILFGVIVSQAVAHAVLSGRVESLAAERADADARLERAVSLAARLDAAHSARAAEYEAHIAELEERLARLAVPTAAQVLKRAGR